jgi:DNA repair protein REV1
MSDERSHRSLNKGSSDKSAANGEDEEDLTINDILVRGKGPALNTHHDGHYNVYMAHKIAKLGGQHQLETADISSNIFRGCFVFVNGFTTPPMNEIKQIVLAHGGIFNQYETGNTTHFVCNNFPQSKIDRLRKGIDKRGIFYVTAAWIIDSVAALKRLNELNYRPDGLFDKDPPIAFKRPRITPLVPLSTPDVPDILSPVRSSDLEYVGKETPQSDGDLIASSNIKHDLVIDESIPSESGTVAENPSDGGRLGTAAPDGYNRGSAENDPNFLQRYFESSRLHFIGTWRSRLPQ